MFKDILQQLKEKLIDFFKERPTATFLGILVFLGAFCGGSYLFGSGPINALERLFFPVRFIVTETGGAEDWYDVYFIDPPQTYDTDHLTGEAPEALLALIENAQDTIHVAAFEFNLTPIAEALIAAQQRGVDVRWYTDDEHGLDADEDEGHGQFQLMAEAGIPVRADERQGLMHNKFIIFDKEIVWTGSTNLTRNGMFKNNNNTLVIHDPVIARRYEKEFTELWKGKSSSERRSPIWLQTTMIEDTPVLVLFAPEDNAMEELLPLIRQARNSIHFMTFAFTHDEMGEELVRQARQGVDVRGVFEARNASDKHSEIHRLYCNDIPVREDGNSANMHHKVFIIDDLIVVTGSYNFSNNSENTNDENLVFLNNSAVAALYEEEFAKVWQQGNAPPQSDIVCP
ncbi:MAG: phospholipase D-like domain-containing protein [Candidatus Promineifilaceae bacterium]